MVHKRPFGDDGPHEVSFKHPRCLEYSNQLVSFLEFVCAEDMAQHPKVSGKGSFTEGDEKHDSGINTKFPLCTEKHIKTNAPGCILNSSLASSCTSEEDRASETPFHESFSPEYYYPDRPFRTIVRSERIYSSLLGSSPCKVVPIGPDFQANVPEWGVPGAKNDSSDGSEPAAEFLEVPESDLDGHNDIENKLTGISVIPMPVFDPSTCNSTKAGDGRTDCYCEDSGSVRCVRQHINEAREKLWRTLGRERFLELGFSDMGEVVAEKWSQEEELLFREVVLTNPASLGKKFWDHLSVVFPSRAKMDIVSYYFNVFILRIRGVQNRCNPKYIDSDDDECQGSDDSGEDGVETKEEDKDSVVEFPVYQGDPHHNEILENSHDYDCNTWCAGFNKCGDIIVGCGGGTMSLPETTSRKLLKNCDGRRESRLSLDEKGLHEVQDCSRSSSGAGTSQVNQGKANNGKCRLGSFNGGDSHEFVSDHCDAVVWEVGHLTFPRNEVEFLPTCSVIEEIWNFVARDSTSLS